MPEVQRGPTRLSAQAQREQGVRGTDRRPSAGPLAPLSEAKWACFRSLFCGTDLRVYQTMPRCLDYSEYLVKFNIECSDSSSFIVPFQGCFSYLGARVSV